MSTNFSFVDISQKVYLYFGQFLLVAGFLGGILNLIVFLSLKTFRESSCASYFIVMSCVNLGQLLTGYLSRIMISGYNIDWTQTSLFYCKFRWFFFQSFTLTSYACMCFATIDQYIATSTYHLHLRQKWNNIKLAYCLCLIAFLLVIVHGIPSIIIFNHIPSPVANRFLCIFTNDFYQKYRTYGFNVVLGGILPVFITILFGSLTYRNIRQIAYRTVPLVRRELDKQLTNMVFVQVIYVFIAIVPYTTVIILLTNLNLQNQPLLTAQLQFAESLGAIIYYSYFIVSTASTNDSSFIFLPVTILYLHVDIKTISSTIISRTCSSLSKLLQTTHSG